MTFPPDELTPLIACHGVTKHFGEGPAGRSVLRGVDLTVNPGRMVALMGPSGSGKSTLLNIIGGLDTASSGEVRVAGKSLAPGSPESLTKVRAETIGFIFQEWNLIRDLTILENVCLPLDLRGRHDTENTKRARRILGLVGIEQHAGAFPDDVSGGEQQRAAIARSLVDDRPVILADEPTGALDHRTGEVVMELLQSMIHGTARACLIATHNPEVASRCDETWHILDGYLRPSGAS